jgi:hypothetical protein
LKLLVLAQINKNKMLAQAPDLESIQSSAGLDLPFTNVAGLISVTLPYVFGIAGIALLIYLVTGGFQMMFARGDPKAIQSAQAKVTNALIGFAIMVVAYFIVQILGQLLGIDVFREVFGGFTRTNE